MKFTIEQVDDALRKVINRDPHFVYTEEKLKACIGECVIGGTSSCHCAHCSERVWFPSYQLDWKSGPVKVFVCPYCNGGNQ